MDGSVDALHCEKNREEGQSTVSPGADEDGRQEHPPKLIAEHQPKHKV